MTLFIKHQGTGQPFVLVHGWGFNHQIWQPVAEQLATQGCIYQIDLPGHGQSPLCSYRLEEIVDCLTEQLPPNAIWLGWSLGGLLTMAVARWRPEYVKALFLIATSPRFTIAEDWPYAMSLSILQNFHKQLQQETVGTLKRFLALQVKDSAQARVWQRQLTQWLSIQGYPSLEALQASLQCLQETDLRSELKQIQQPAFLGLGELDALVPVKMATLCQTWWPKLQTVAFSGAAHIPFLSNFTQVMQCLQDFLHENALN